jgi:hypothetical protein
MGAIGVDRVCQENADARQNKNSHCNIQHRTGPRAHPTWRYAQFALSATGRDISPSGSALSLGTGRSPMRCRRSAGTRSPRPAHRRPSWTRRWGYRGRRWLPGCARRDSAPSAALAKAKIRATAEIGQANRVPALSTVRQSGAELRSRSSSPRLTARKSERLERLTAMYYTACLPSFVNWHLSFWRRHWPATRQSSVAVGLGARGSGA